MNLPNKLTMFRIILIPFFIIFMMLPFGKIPAVIIFIVACLTDTADGYIARKYNLVTDFGKFMDPLADKLLVASALILFAANGQIPAWIVIIIVAREFIISGFRLIAADNGLVIAASMWGKVKTFVTMVMLVVLILHFDATWWYVLEQILIYASLVLTVVSLIDYLIKNKNVISSQK